MNRSFSSPRSTRSTVLLVTTLSLAALVGCSGADESDTDGPLPRETWSTTGETTPPSAASTTTTTTTTSGDAGTGATSASPAPSADAGSPVTFPTSADAAAACVSPTDVGNSAGVGKFCATADDCGQGLLCSAEFGAPAGDTFCSKICATDADCGGSGATCFAGGSATGGTKACVTAACAGTAATLF